jgi:hypothetical protein
MVKHILPLWNNIMYGIQSQKSRYFGSSLYLAANIIIHLKNLEQKSS